MARETELFAIVAMWIDRKKGEAAAEIDVALVRAGQDEAQRAAAQLTAKLHSDKPERYSFVKRLDKDDLLKRLIDDKRQPEGEN